MIINLSTKLTGLILLAFSSSVTFACLSEETTVDHNDQKISPSLNKLKKNHPSRSISDKSYMESYHWLKSHFPFKSKRSVKAIIIPKRRFPSCVDLRDQFPKPYNQGKLGSCTVNALASVVQFIRRKEGLEDYTLSRLMLYYLARQYRGAITQDRGVYITEGIRALCEYGTCSEGLWPYEDYEKKFRLCPSPKCFEAAQLARITENIIPFPLRQTTKSFKKTLMNGQPIVLSSHLYESFDSNETKKTGLIPLPDFKKEKKVESHALTLVGYNDLNKCFIVRNSWGENWGHNGYCYMPYKYILNKRLTYDCWSMKRASLVSSNFLEQPSEVFYSSNKDSLN